MSKADRAMGDIDAASSKQQVPGVYKDPTPPSKELIAGMDIDEGHGGINQTVQAADGASGSTTSTSHSSTSPSAADLGIN